jgi:superfamily II DNA helicase RecQ
VPKEEVESKYATKMDECLHQVFGHPQFRPSQRDVILSILSGIIARYVFVISKRNQNLDQILIASLF